LIQGNQEIFEEKKDDLSFENKGSVEVLNIENKSRLSNFMVSDDGKKNVDEDNNSNDSNIVENDENLNNVYKDGLRFDIIDPFDTVIDSLNINKKNENNHVIENNHENNFDNKKKINVKIMENIIMENVIIPNKIIHENNEKYENEFSEISNSVKNNYDYFKNGEKIISDTNRDDLNLTSSESDVKDKTILNDLNLLKSKDNLSVAQMLPPPSPPGTEVSPTSMAAHIQVDNMYTLRLLSICVDIYHYSFKIMYIYI
jgi:hypothetical protein